MIEALAIVCLTILALALLVARFLDSRAFDRERKELLDRIQAPQVSQIAAAERLMPKPEPQPEPEPYYVPTTDPDLAFLENA